MRCNKDNKEKIAFSVIKGCFFFLLCTYILVYLQLWCVLQNCQFARNKAEWIACLETAILRINKLLRKDVCRISFLLAVTFEQLFPINKSHSSVKLRLGSCYAVASVALSCFATLSYPFYSVWVFSYTL